MRQFVPPPLQVEPIEPGTTPARFSPQWLKWFTDIANRNLYYGVFYSMETQAADTLGAPQAVRFEKVKAQTQVVIPDQKTKIRFRASGLYRIIFEARFVSSTAIRETASIWIRHNGQDVEDSAVQTFLVAGDGEYVYLHALQGVNAGDYLEIYWLTTSVGVKLFAAEAAPGFVPGSPSARIEISQVELWDATSRF